MAGIFSANVSSNVAVYLYLSFSPKANAYNSSGFNQMAKSGQQSELDDKKIGRKEGLFVVYLLIDRFISDLNPFTKFLEKRKRFF